MDCQSGRIIHTSRDVEFRIYTRKLCSTCSCIDVSWLNDSISNAEGMILFIVLDIFFYLLNKFCCPIIFWLKILPDKSITDLFLIGFVY